MSKNISGALVRQQKTVFALATMLGKAQHCSAATVLVYNIKVSATTWLIFAVSACMASGMRVGIN